MSYADLGGDPWEAERTDADVELAEYIEEFGLDVGLALYREDNGLDLSSADYDALERFANDDRGINDDINDNGDIERDINELEDDPEIGIELDGADELDIDELAGEYDPFDRDDALDLSPDNGFEPYEYEYIIYLNDGGVREGTIMVYHEDTDIEDAIWAANDDLDYEDGVIG